MFEYFIQGLLSIYTNGNKYFGSLLPILINKNQINLVKSVRNVFVIRVQINVFHNGTVNNDYSYEKRCDFYLIFMN